MNTNVFNLLVSAVTWSARVRINSCCFVQTEGHPGIAWLPVTILRFSARALSRASSLPERHLVDERTCYDEIPVVLACRGARGISKRGSRTRRFFGFHGKPERAWPNTRGYWLSSCH